MLGVHRRSKSDVENALCVARDTLVTKLSNIAKDGYKSSYLSLVKIQCLREIEDANIFLGEEDLHLTPIQELCRS